MMDLENEKKDPIGLSKEDLETLFESTFQKINLDDSKAPNNDHLPPLLEAKNNAFPETENQKTKSPKNIPEKGDRTRSSLRLKYEAETSVIKKSLGDIEDIRRQLGLSKRKMAQLLLVDPSAWTRWTRRGEEPPPHIYRSLQWFMILQEKHPELRSSVWLNAVAQPKISRHEIESIKKSIREDFAESENKTQTWDHSSELSTSLKRQLDKSKLQIQMVNRNMKFLISIQVLLIAAYVVILLF